MCVAPFQLPRPHRKEEFSEIDRESQKVANVRKRVLTEESCPAFWHQLKGKDCPNSDYARMTTMQWKHYLGSLE